MALKFLRGTCGRSLLILEPFVVLSRFAFGRVVFEPGHVFLRSNNELHAGL
jgi:hypothetical protein